jgi:uncharacterized Zn-finger protein
VPWRGESGYPSPALAPQSSFPYAPSSLHAFSQSASELGFSQPSALSRYPPILPANMQDGGPSTPSALPSSGPPTCTEGPCALNPKVFEHTWELNKHKKTHDLPYKCPFEGCPFSDGGLRVGFRQQRDLDRHLETHDPVRAYCCYSPGCGSTATRNYNMKRHLRLQHNIEITQADVEVLCSRK